MGSRTRKVRHQPAATATIEPSGNIKVGRPLLLVAVVGTLFWILEKPAFFQPFLMDFDAGNFALGVRDYNVQLHQPHPPGYPLWILALWILRPFIEPPLAMTWLAFAFALAALYWFFQSARDLYGTEVGLTLTLLLAFALPVRTQSISQANYTIDLLASAFVGLMSWKLWEGDTTVLRKTAVAVALLMGLRQSSMAFLLPLLLVAALKAGWKHKRDLLVSGGLGLGVFLCWYLPAAYMNGGPIRFQELTRNQLRASARWTSPLYGAPMIEWRIMLTLLATVLAVSLVVLLPGLRLRKSALLERRPGAWFYLLWIFPALLFITFVHFPKQGYILVLLPPLFLLAGTVFTRRDLWAVSALGIALSFGTAYLKSPWFAKHWPAVNWFLVYRQTPEFLLETYEMPRILHRFMATRSAAGTVIVGMREGSENPNRRTLPMDFDSYRVLVAEGENGWRWFYRGVASAAPPDLAGLKEVVWVSNEDRKPHDPQAKEMARQMWMSIWAAPYVGQPPKELLLRR